MQKTKIKAIRRFTLGFALVAALTACGGGGGSSPEVAGEPLRANISCSYDHVYITVAGVRALQHVGGAETWVDVALATPQRIDLVGLGGGVLQAVGAALLPAGHYTEVRLVLAEGDAANQVQPTGGALAPLAVPSAARSGLKLTGDFLVPAGQTGDVVLDGFDACRTVVAAGNPNALTYQLKPQLPVTLQLAAVDVESTIGPGTVTAVIGGGHTVTLQQGTSTWVIQRYGAEGQPTGGTATIAPATTPADNWAAMVPLTGGGYAVTWLRTVEFQQFGGSIYQIYTQAFTADGAAIGSPLPVAQTVPGRYWISRPLALPQMAALAGGGYVVAWALQPPLDTAVYAQRFNADGSPAAAAVQVTPDGSGYLGVTGLASGGYMVHWGGTGTTGHVRAFSSADVALAPAQAAGPSWWGMALQAAVTEPVILTPLAGGGAAMVWLGPVSADSATRFVHVLQLAPDGTVVSQSIADGSVLPGTAHEAPAVFALADGGYVVAWIESGEVHARRFTASGAPAGPETRINLVTTGAQAPVAVVAQASGGFMITWSGLGSDGVRANYGRRFTASGLLAAP